VGHGVVVLVIVDVVVDVVVVVVFCGKHSEKQLFMVKLFSRFPQL